MNENISKLKLMVGGKMENFLEKFKSWFAMSIIYIMIGIAIGIFGSKAYVNMRMDENIKIQGMVYKQVVYEIKPRAF